MKKIKLAAVLLSSFFAISVLSACEQKTEEAPKDYVLTNHTLNDFSNSDDLYQIIWQNSYVKASLNKESAYKKTGEASAKISINSLSESDGQPLFFKQRVASEYLNYDYSDFSHVKKVKAQIYNPSEETVRSYMYFTFKGGASSIRKTFDLTSGWNEIVYELDRESMSMQADLSKVEYILFGFDRKETAFDVYIDCITLTKTSKDIESIEMSLKENEIASFDKNYQKSVFTFWTWSQARMGDIVDYGLTANPEYVKSGSSFYVTTKKGETYRGVWYYLQMNEAFADIIAWNSLKSGDSIELSIYNKGPADDIALRITTPLGAFGLPPETGEARWALPENQWTTITFSYDYAAQKALEGGFLGKDQELKDVITGFELSWAEFVNVSEKTFYFDEFKIVRGATE